MSEIGVPTSLTDAMGELTAALKAHTAALSQMAETVNAAAFQPPQVFKCSSCLSKKQQALADIENGVLWDGDKPTVNEINMADAWLPSWQTTMVQGQMVLAAVALPCCEGCAIHNEPSVVEKMAKSGLILGQ